MKNEPIDCAAAAELFPWYLNGTLAPDESASIEAHLESCPRCRQEHRETAFAAAAYNAHPSAEQLVRYAFHEVSLGPQRTLLEDHLRGCSSCAEELRLVEASRDRQHADAGETLEIPSGTMPAPLPFRRPEPRPSGAWRLGAIAASIVAILAAGYWLWNLGSPSGSVGSGGPAIAGIEGPGGDLPPAADGGLRVVAATSGTFDPASSVLRLAERASEVELTLTFDGAPPEGTAELEVLDSVGRRLWRGSALEAIGGSRFQARLPVEALPEGELTLRVRRRQGGRSVPYAQTSLQVETAP